MLEDADVLGDLDQLRSRYDVLRHLGEDGGCAVYAVRARSASQHYLVKVMPKPGSGSAQAGTLHLWQAHTMARLDHPKLIGLHTVNHLQGGTLAVAMERRRGETLAERIERAGPLPIAEVESALRDVAEALAYLHGRGVVHRGVNLDSVLLDRDSGCARLSHFGIPRGSRGGDVAPGDRALRRRGAGEPTQPMGEKAAGGAADLGPRGDLYGLGLVGYAMLTGSEFGPFDTAASPVSGSLPPLETLRTDAPVYLCRAIEGCLQRDPRSRWRDAEEFLRRLDPAAEEAPPAPRAELSWLRADWEGPLTAARAALAGPWDAQRRRNVALALPAALLTTLAWAMLRSDGTPESPAPERERVTSVAADAGEPTRGRVAERASPAGAVLPATGVEVATAEPEESLPLPRRFDRQPVAEPSPPASAARSRRAVRRAGSTPPSSEPRRAEASAGRRPPVPLLGEELASAGRGR